MNRLLFQDNLTRLANRKQFVIAFENSVKKSIQKQLNISLLLIELDGLKVINKKYGHQSGDLVISTFATLLSKCIHFSDQVFRYGGDQFTVILNHTEDTSITDLVKQICNALDSNDIMREFAITCTIGRADADRYDDFYSLVERTEQALNIKKNVPLTANINNPLYDLYPNDLKMQESARR